MDKNDPLVVKVKEWVDKEYEEGRVTVITDEEILRQISKVKKELGIDTW